MKTLKMTVCKEFTFDAAHYLPSHEGLCRNMHGHTYRLLVGISGPIVEDEQSSMNGMVLDFSQLKSIVQALIIKRLDHKMLNDVLPFVTTAENMAFWMFKEIEGQLSSSLTMEFIRLYETPTSYAEVKA